MLFRSAFFRFLFRLRRSFLLVGCLVELVSDHDDAVVFHAVLVNPFFRFEVALHCEQGTLGDLGKRIGATLNAADLKAGSKFPINFVPKGNLGYMRLYYTPTADTSKTITAGAITAGIVAAHDNSYHDM